MMGPGSWFLVLLACLSSAAQELTLDNNPPPCSVGSACDIPDPNPAPPCTFGSDCGNLEDTETDPQNLPPSWDDKRTVAGTVQGVVKEDGSYVEGLTPTIITNRTTAFLNCTSGSMNVRIQFKEPFYGIVYANFDRYSACKTLGEGGTVYSIDLPLRGCGTIQDPPQVFINNIIVRFHAGLELDGDEVKTIICKYPPPLVIPARPLPPLNPLIEPPPVVPIPQDKMGELEILLIICSILFLAFLLLGGACSYYCLKRRNIRIVKKKAASTMGAGSEITKITGSTLGQFEIGGLRIPRAHASVSGSETNILVSNGDQSDTIPSDYPSESPSSIHSEVEDVDTKSLRRPSTVSSHTSTLKEETITEFVKEEFSSVYSDRHLQIDTEITEKQIISKPEPKFEIAVRVKKAPEKPDMEMLKAQEKQLSTILERGETRYSEETYMSKSKMTTEEERYLETEMRIPRPKRQQPPVISRIQRQPQSDAGSIVKGSIPDNDNWSMSEHMESVPRRKFSVSSNLSLNTLNTENTDTRSMSEYTIEPVTRVAPPPEPSLPLVSDYASESRSVSDIYEPEGQLVPRRPVVTSHIVDDRLVSTITETRTYDDITRHTREVTEYHTKKKPKPTPVNWDVIIRNYPSQKKPDERSLLEWERFSTDTESERPPSIFDGPEDNVTSMQVAPTPEPPKNWQVLIRVLHPPEEEEDTISILSEEDKHKWARIITTESTLRTMLSEATIREDFEKIRKDQRYEKLFEPKKWDVIIRVLANPEELRQPRYRKKSDYDNRSRRSSLPPVYESDTVDGDNRSRGAPSTRSRRTSHSSIPGSEYDMRSMTEVDVDFSRYDRDSLSEISGHTGRYPRSIADRATSEIVEDVPTMYQGRYARSLSHRSLADSEVTDWEPMRDERYDRLSQVTSTTHDGRRMVERSSTEVLEDIPQRALSYQGNVSSPDQSPRLSRYSRVADTHFVERSSNNFAYTEGDVTEEERGYYYSSSSHKQVSNR